MLQSKIPDKQYVISLDTLDLSFLSQYVEKITEDRKLLWSKPFMDGGSPYYQVELVSEELQDEDYCLELYETYLCNLCNMEVPKTCYRQHIKSKMHQCYEILTEKVLENVTKQIKKSIDYNMNDNERDSYYCEICSKLVSVKYKKKHNLSSYHLKSIEKEKLANNFLDMYLQTQATKSESNIYSDENENLSEYNSILNTNCSNVENMVQKNNSLATVIPINHIGPKPRDIIPLPYESEDEEDVSASSTPTKALIFNENRINVELYLKEMIAKYKLNFKIPMVENNYIVIVTPKGYEESVTIDNFHGYKKVVSIVYCQLCDIWVGQNVEQHSATELHVRNIIQPVNDNFLREVITRYTIIPNHQFNHCLICNEIVSAGSNHALVNPNHKKYNHRNVVENTEILMTSRTTFCDVCSISICTANFPAHTKGKKHKTKLNTQINTKSVLNEQPNGVTSLDSTSCPESVLHAIYEKNLEPNSPSRGIPVKINNKTFCDICHIDIYTHNFASHIRGKKHGSNLMAKVDTPVAKLPEDLGSKDENVTSNNVCNICQVLVPLGGMGIHIAGKTHRKNQIKNHKTEGSQIPTETTKRKRKRTRPKKNKTQTVEGP